MPADLDPRLLSVVAENRWGLLATIRGDGRPQLSNVGYAWDDGLIRISVTADRAKTRNLQRDPRLVLHVQGGDLWTWAAVEGTAELSPVAADPHDATVEELIEVYRLVGGKEHPDWDDYRRAMVADGRLVLRIHVERLYG